MKQRASVARNELGMVVWVMAAVLLATAFVAGCTPSVPQGEPEADVDIYERMGVKIAIPKEYADDLLVDPQTSDNPSILLGVYQKSSYEKHAGMGRLFRIARYTKAQYEQFLCQDGSGMSFFAKDEENNYYGFFIATDVAVAPGCDHDQFTSLLKAVGDFVKSDLITRNGLLAYSDNEFFSRTYTYPGEHTLLSYRPYEEDMDVVWTLVLSQPQIQGEGGIWCVERWKDEYGNIYPYFPDKQGTPSSVHYAELQASAYDAELQAPVDPGDGDSLLDPTAVALAFVHEVLGHPRATLLSFGEGPDFFSPEDLFARSTGNIHDYLPALIAGESVSDYDLLPCFAAFTRATWLELGTTYGGPGNDWFNPFFDAVRKAAIGDASDQSLRDYYLGLLFLTSDGAYSESLMDIIASQWVDHPVTYSECLKSCFSEEDEETLRKFIMYALVYEDEGIFTLTLPSSSGSIYLGASPIDFPFGLDLVETKRESRRVESFGNATTIWCDGLQVTYLHNHEGIFTVTNIRSTTEHHAVADVSIGDTEGFLLEMWPTKLTKIDSISYDDEEWFGPIYDYAYGYSEPSGTKSAVFLVKDGVVVGIDLVDGLDGSMYPGATP